MARMTDWRDIETAPKDGTPILAYDPKGVHVPGYWWGCDDDGYHRTPLPCKERIMLHIVPARWKEPDGCTDDGHLWASPMGYYDFGVYDDPSCEWIGVEIAPTHWMPLPEPPRED